MDISRQLARSQAISDKVSLIYRGRLQAAGEHLANQLQAAYLDAGIVEIVATPTAGARLWTDWVAYAVDAAQRAVLFWDTIRRRGNNFVEHETRGLPPVLHFAYETVIDGRSLERPVNYALVRIVPPAGLTVDPKRRPYLIIDPRAGHGPGIGGFKDDSQVGVALREGHPVYFVIFFPEPESGQTLLDVCEAEKGFVRKVRDLHPDSPKPAIVGNCQGGWAAMMLAAADPDDTGPIVINGAPMSYWGGAWRDGDGDNPMRYAGGMLGGTWLASLCSDLGNGVFDGAYLVQNFEYLNPANTFWDKYYHLYAHVDTEPPRFLDFERYWGGFYLMNREEIEWITRNLFVGNRLWNGATRSKTGKFLDLREIRAPIILFASMGDNITPPQQAFNWVADVYGSTEEIKARGQVIVGLLHEDVGHLGIFVSGKVARKEYTQIVSVLKSIELLAPGLYAMEIHERDVDGTVRYDVEFHEQKLEEVAARLNRYRREDEKPFEAVAEVSEFIQRAYELFLQPLVQAMTNDFTAQFQRRFHPMRLQRWAFSDFNPWLSWLASAAQAVKSQRQAIDGNNAVVRLEKVGAAVISASLEYHRALRDASTEATFFELYGSVFSLCIVDKRAGEQHRADAFVDARELPFVRAALESIERGGYAEALARVACLLARRGGPVHLSNVEAGQEVLADYREFLPAIPPDAWRRLAGEQDIVVRYEPEKALDTLPLLLGKRADRERLVALLQRLLADERLHRVGSSPEQLTMLRTVCDTLAVTDASSGVARAAPPALVAPSRARAA